MIDDKPSFNRNSSTFPSFSLIPLTTNQCWQENFYKRHIMDTNLYKHGAFPQDNEKVRFSVWAPEKEKIEVIINGELSHPLHKQDTGYWSALLNAKVGDRYMFRINDELERPDPASLSQPEGVHGLSEIVDLNKFGWKDIQWSGLPLRDMIIYELHIGTFSQPGDFQGIIQKLPYLSELGINAIELMPIAQFAGERNWGYDGVYPFAVQNSYGGQLGLKKLVDEAHLHGIAVILDVVYNHLGPEGNYFNDFGPYFTDKYKTPWGKAINFDDAWCDGVRDYYIQNALMWLHDFHIDGLRLDAVHAIWDSSAYHFVQELSDKVRNLEAATGKKKVLIAEFDLNNPRYINPKEIGGYNLDGQWVDEFHHALHSVVTGETDGYYEDFGPIADLEKSYKDTYVYTGQFSKHRKKNFGVLPTNPYGQFVTFAQNHDQVGNRMEGERLSKLVSSEVLKLIACSYILSPHVPMLFMGEEYGEKNPFQYFISHTDKDLVELVRKGRREEFSYFKWKGEVPDPFALETFNRSRLSWPSSKGSPLFEYYRHLIKLRRSAEVLRADARDTLVLHPAPSKNIIVFERLLNNEKVIVILNFNKEQVVFGNILDKKCKLVSDSSSTEWGGPRNGLLDIHSAEITMSPESALIVSIN